MTKTNEHLANTNEPHENILPREGNYAFSPKNKSHQWKQIKPDLLVNCLLCDTQFNIRYIAPKKQYSLKNNWGYWTGKINNQHKYLCDSCLVKILAGKKFDAFDWIPA